MLEEFEHKVKETARKICDKKALAVGAVGTLYVSAQYRAPNLVKKLDINDSVLAVYQTCQYAFNSSI